MREKLLLIGVIVLFAGGCAVKPVPITKEEVETRIKRDHEQMFQNQEPLSGPVSLWEALARALKYNLDHRVKLREIALAHRILDTTNYTMLPLVAASAGYNHRNNDSGGISKSLLTGRTSLEPSTSEERNYYNAGLTVVWNVLDFGVSHAIAKQKANDVLIAQERRRRVIQNIMVDTYDAYWRAVAAEQLLKEINSLLKDTQSALERSRTMEKRAVQHPEIALTYQKRLLETLQRLYRLREEMILSKGQLAALINLPVSSSYEVVIPPQDMPPELNFSLEQLENQAMVNQPELLEEDYKARNKVLEVKKAVRRMFPGLEISFGGDYNTNRYLYNQSWFSAGLRVSWNVLQAFTVGPAAKKEAKAHVILAEHRRMALAMAILTQVWVSHQRYALARDNYLLSDELYSVHTKLERLISKGKQAKTRSRQDVVLADTDELVAHMGRELALAELYSAVAKTYHTVGWDPLPKELLDEAPGSFASYDVASLAAKISVYAAKIENYLETGGASGTGSPETE
ncbi:MAG: TolC family protein [Gammaproteobacteria bacterium]|nr:TolC family protein [Gammaproteobacteria bacterium]